MYGVSENGFVKKPYEVIVEELETDYKRIFGDSINLATEGPQGQMIAIHAEGIYDMWEMAESIYASYNIDTVSGLLLDDRAMLRGAIRLSGESDEEFRVRIEEQLPNDVFKLKDELHDNLLRVPDVSDVVVKYFQGLTRAFVVGGDDVAVATTLLDYMPPGALEGNVSVPVDGRCDGVKFYRPKFVFAEVSVVVGHFANLECECKAIDIEAIADSVKNESCGIGYGEYLYSDYIRNIISQFKGLRVVSIEIKRSVGSYDSAECRDDVEYDVEYGDSVDVVEVALDERVVLCSVGVSIDGV